MCPVCHPCLVCQSVQSLLRIHPALKKMKRMRKMSTTRVTRRSRRRPGDRPVPRSKTRTPLTTLAACCSQCLLLSVHSSLCSSVYVNCNHVGLFSLCSISYGRIIWQVWHLPRKCVPIASNVTYIRGNKPAWIVWIWVIALGSSRKKMNSLVHGHFNHNSLSASLSAGLDGFSLDIDWIS